MFDTKTEQPEWRTVYAAFRHVNYGTVITYERLEEILGRDVRLNRYPVLRAIKECEREDSRTFEAEPNVGYRCVQPVEHMRLGVARHKRARKQMAAAVRKFTSAERSRLTPEERARIDALEHNLRSQQAMLSRLDGRVGRVEKDVVKQGDKYDRLVEALKRHGIPVDVEP